MVMRVRNASFFEEPDALMNRVETWSPQMRGTSRQPLLHEPDEPSDPLEPGEGIDYESLFQDLLAREDDIPYMYLCARGRVTVAVGNMLPDVASAQKLPFTHVDAGRPATPGEIETNYLEVAAMPKGKGAGYYKKKPSLELTDASYRKELAIGRLKHEYLPQWTHRVHDFIHLPNPVISVLFDMAYNAGVSGTLRKIGGAAVLEQGQWDWLYEHCEFDSSDPQEAKAQHRRANERREKLEPYTKKQQPPHDGGHS